MKKNIRIIFLVIMLCALSTQAFAQSTNQRVNVEAPMSMQRDVISNDKISKVLAAPRGRVISFAGLQISDEGNGVLGVYADTFCHINVKEIGVMIFLEMWNPNSNDYQQIESHEYTWDASDNPDGKLSVTTVSFDLTGLQRGREYRLRAFHTAESMEGITESLITKTDKILLK